MIRAAHFIVLLLFAGAAWAEEWQAADLPAYAQSVPFAVIGSDGFLFGAASNDSSGQFFALEPEGGDTVTFYLLSGDLSPVHDC